MSKILQTLSIVTIMLLCMMGCTSSDHRAQEFYAQGISLLDKDLVKAEKAFKNALVMKSNMHEAMYGLAIIRERQGATLNDIFKYLDLAIEQNPSYLQALIKSCQILALHNKLDLALINCDKALDLDKKNIEVLNLKADIQLKLGDPVGAISFANRVIAINSGTQDTYLLLARERLLAKDEIQAIAYLNKASSENNDLTILLLKASLYESVSNQEQAELTYKNAIKMFPESVLVKKRYINFLINLGRKDDAEKQLRVLASSGATGSVQTKLDIVKFVTDNKGAEAGQAELESLVGAEPNNYGLAYVLLNLYQSQNESAKEDMLLQKIVISAGKTADGYRARGLIAEKLIRLGKSNEADKMLMSILESDNRNAQALILKADLAIVNKDYVTAIAYLRSVINDSPKSNSVALKLANVYESSNSIALAEEHFAKAYNNSKYSQTYAEPYAQFLMRNKQPKLAEEILKKLHSNQVASSHVTKVSRVANDQLTNQIYSSLLSSKNDTDGSLSSYSRANEIDSDKTGPILEIVNACIQAEKYNEAHAILATALNGQPDNTDLMLAKSKVYDVSGDSETAVQVLKDVIHLDSGNTSAYQSLALIYLNMNNVEDALAIVSKGLSFLPDDFELKLIKGKVFEASERTQEALKLYEDMMLERPNSIMLSNAIVRLSLESRGSQLSTARMQSLLDILKNNQAPQFLETYGMASYRAGKLAEGEQALRSLKLSLDHYPKNIEFNYHLAKLYLAKKDHENAKKKLNEVLNLSKNQRFMQTQEVNQLLEAL